MVIIKYNGKSPHAMWGTSTTYEQINYKALSGSNSSQTTTWEQDSGAKTTTENR